MVKKFIYTILLLVVLSSCHYSVYSNAYPHLRKIRILAFENRTSEYGLGDKLLNYLNREIREDGRLKLVTEDPDCTLEGAILSFSENVYSYDAANQVQDYQVKMVVSVTFTDLINNTVLYQNSGLTVTELYAVGEGGTAKFYTKEEAVEELISKLYKTILQNSIEGW